MNKWSIAKEIEDIREVQQKSVYESKVFDYMNPDHRAAAAQVIANQRNLDSIPDQHIWNKIKSSIVARLFINFRQKEPSDYTSLDTEWPKNASLVGLRPDNRTIVLEDGQDTVWTVEPIERELKAKWAFSHCQDLKASFNLDPYEELAAITAMEIALDIVKEVKGDLENLYCKNNILQYNYCLHSFRLGEMKNDPEEFYPRRPILMKYIKTATFGD
jgi:hypothetical protein